MLEQFMSLINGPALSQWLFAITSVVTAASAVTALTPTKTDDKIRTALLKILNFLALNVGNAKRKDGGND